MAPVPMRRVALLAPRDALRAMLVALADAGTVALDEIGGDGAPTAAADLLRRLAAAPPPPAIAAQPDLDGWARTDRLDLIAGEAQLERHAAQALRQGNVAALTGWMPSRDIGSLAGRIAGIGGAVVPLPRPTGTTPPTLLPEGTTTREFTPLVETYATVPYRDLNPAPIAGLAYVLMFGMMFADAGHGALLLLAALVIRLQWVPRLAPLRQVWGFVAGAGAASIVFGVLYGEFFGPTHVLPVIWLAPLDHPVPLLAAAVGVGAVLLAGAYAVGSINRFREGGWRRACYAPSGLAGAALFVGLAAVVGGIYLHHGWLLVLGGAVTAVGLAVAYSGLLAAAGGGGPGATQAGIELFDMVLRLGSNLVSFARLAAFGLTHAALGAVIWGATAGLAHRGPAAIAGAVVIFVLGNALAFALEGLVAGVQALRLEYYELFSRIFDGVGRPFRPWRLPLVTEEVPC